MKVDRGDDKIGGIIQLDSTGGGDLDLGSEYRIKRVSGDIILVQLEDGDGDHKKVGDIYLPTQAMNKKLWRTGKVIMVGPKATEYEVGQYVTFPNDRGLNTKTINVSGVGIINHAVFLNEERIFGECEKVHELEKITVESYDKI